MKPVKVYDGVSDIPWWRERAIFITRYPQYKDSFQSVVASNGKLIVWGFGIHNYTIRNPGDKDINCSWRSFGAEMSRDQFFLRIADWYPEDFEIFIWHPELKYGNFIETP